MTRKNLRHKQTIKYWRYLFDLERHGVSKIIVPLASYGHLDRKKQPDWLTHSLRKAQQMSGVRR